MSYPKLTPIIAKEATEPRYLEDRFADQINVKDFGATGDGTTDDTAAIKSAVEASNGKTIFFPSGSYVVSEGIDLLSDSHVLGAGAQSTQIVAVTQNMIVFSNGAITGRNYVYIKELSIHSRVSGVTGIKIESCFEWCIDSIDFFGCSCAVEIKNGGLHTIDSCSSSGEASYNLGAGNIKIWESTDSDYVANSRISNLQINGGSGFTSPALDFRRAVAIRVDNFILNWGNYTGVGISLENDCQGCCFSNCIIVAVGTAILMKQGSGIVKWPIVNTFTNFDIDQCSAHAIHIQEGSENIFSGCIITSSGFYPETQAVLLEGNYPHYNGFYNCHISGYHESTGTCITLKNAIGTRIVGNEFAWSYVGVKSEGTNSKTLIASNDFNGGGTGCTAAVFGSELSDSEIKGNRGYDDATNLVISNNSPSISLKNKSVARDGTLSAEKSSSLTFVDANNKTLAFVSARQNTSGVNSLLIAVFKNQTQDQAAAFSFTFENTGETYLKSLGIIPYANNNYSLGSAALTWANVYTYSGAVSTSDERLKDSIKGIDESLMQAWKDVKLKVFKFKSSIEEKGKEKARVHVGYIAQDILKAFSARNIDANRYGLFCYDEWDDQFADEIVGQDEENNPIFEKKKVVEAGNKYGIRYDEALALECAHLRWRLEQLEERVNKLTNSSNNSNTSNEN